MVAPVALLLVNLIHIILGTFGLVFLLLVFSSVQELLATQPDLLGTRNLLAVAVALAALAWALTIITGPMGAPAVQDGALYQVRVVAGLAFTAFVLYTAAGAIAAVAYQAYPNTLLASASGLLLASAVLTLAYGACGVVLGRAPRVVVLPSDALPGQMPIDALAPYASV